MIFETVIKKRENFLNGSFTKEEVDTIAKREVSIELSNFILKNVDLKNFGNDIIGMELFIASKDQWVLLRKLIDIYFGKKIPYQLESLLLAMEQQKP